MSLESGKYTITSKLDSAPVGRHMIENGDTVPKGIYKLPKDIQPPHLTTVSNLDLIHTL